MYHCKMFPQLLSTVLCWTFVLSNQFSPHVFPKLGPYFEGWYMRVIDVDQAISIGLLFGHVHPKQGNSTSALITASILFSHGCGSCKLQSYNAFFHPSQLNLTVHGHPVKSNPDDISPAFFEWRLGPNITFITQGDSTKFDLNINGLMLRGVVSAPVPWGPYGEGPEGYLEHLPLPLHWFVYSLQSNITYEFINPATGQSYTGSNAVAHMEKNWGESFPSAWIWIQGFEPKTRTTLSLSGGLLTLDFATVTAYLIGYFNPSKKLSLKYKPSNSLVESAHNGCAGFVNITAFGLEYKLFVNIVSEPAAFSNCLYGPQVVGFRPVCVESYSAIASVTVYRFDDVIDVQTIHYAALEFGGKYVCNDKCSNML